MQQTTTPVTERGAWNALVAHYQILEQIKERS
jgi:hypothetical protein